METIVNLMLYIEMFKKVDKDVYVIEWKIKCKNCFDMKLIGNRNFGYGILKLFVHKM